MNYTEIQHRLDVPLMDFSLYKEGDAYVELVAAQVSAFEDTPKGMVDQEIHRQEYIYYRHTGLVDDIADSFGSMYHWAADNDIPAGR